MERQGLAASRRVISKLFYSSSGFIFNARSCTFVPMAAYAKVSLWLALFFMMGHNLYAHSHDDEGLASYCEKHDDHYSLFHMLAHLFETDLGEDHLECFNTPVSHTSAALHSQGHEAPLYLVLTFENWIYNTTILQPADPGGCAGRAPPFA
jgi:hypothetical protein